MEESPMLDQNNALNIRLHSYNGEGGCMADITLPETGIQVQNLKVMRSVGDGIQVHMPSWMHSRWGYLEISWAEVRLRITEYYLSSSVSSPEEKFRIAFERFDRNADKQIPETLRTPCLRFYNSMERTECLADVMVVEENTTIRDFFLTYGADDAIWVHMPQNMRGVWSYERISWEALRDRIAGCFRAHMQGVDKLAHENLTIQFREQRQVTLCMADVALPGKRSVMKGFRLKIMEDGLVRVSPPKWMNGSWRSNDLAWNQLTEIIRTAYKNQEENAEEKASRPKSDKVVVQEPQTSEKIPNSSADAKPRQTNELGRIQNAEFSPFRFVPQTVLRLEKTEGGFDNRRNADALVYALTKGPNGGIGPMEIKIVSWVEQLRYLTSTMLTDLFQGGYISRGWREKVNRNKISDMIGRMDRFGLVELTRFVAVDENGVIQGNKRSAGRILTLGRQGSNMLHEMGISTSRYRPFDIFQDGNTVKRYLAANQWMIYWMIHFPEYIGDDYDAARVVYQRGSDVQGARLYATVTCNGCTMVAEPVRRVEEFEVKSNRVWLRDKLSRFLDLFSHMDELYSGREELVFAQRPVLVYVCEDDDHIHEIWDYICDMVTVNSDQEVWFTSDPRIFNYNMVGQRFLKMTNNGLLSVDLAARIGVEEKM